jgi:hypothetical protein
VKQQMQVSAEIRWFWREGAQPSQLKDWFCAEQAHGCLAGGGNEAGRLDEYLSEAGQVELGVKLRGGKKGVEVKGLVESLFEELTVPPFVGAIELWTKWTSHALVLNSGVTVATKKRRWLRKFDAASDDPKEIPLDANENPLGKEALPVLGCNVELTHLELPDGRIWWTFAFEAFGSVQTVAGSLHATADTLARRQPPALGEALVASYPAWLSALDNVV